MKWLIDPEVEQRVERLELPFNRLGLDPYGISRRHLMYFFSFLTLFYRNYFRVRTSGIEHVPARGRAMLVGNHSGGLPFDGGMVMASVFLEMDPPRLAHGMVEKFAQTWPFVSLWLSRVGQFTGLPAHAIRFLQEDRMLLVFPEGVRGVGKLHKDRYKLMRFGTGFMRLALQTNTPIVPLAFIGAEDSLPVIANVKPLARLFGAPYFPVTPYLIPLPMPFPCQIHYSEPMRFEGDGNESDEVIEEYVEQVKQRISGLISHGLESREAGRRS